MDQGTPAQSIELNDFVEGSPSSSPSDQPPHDVSLETTQTESNHVAGSDQSMTTNSTATDETGIRGILKHCSSQRMGVVFGFLALVIAIYSYYGQYQLSWKSWELGLWKDCRDRNVIADSITCQRYQNITYDQIAARDLKSSLTSTLSPSYGELSPSNLVGEQPSSGASLVVQASASMLDCFILIAWFGAIGAVVFHVLVFVSDMTSGHPFPYRAYLAVYVLINTSIATVTCSHWAMKTVCGLLSMLNLVFHFKLVKPALKICVEARHNPSTKAKWERESISGLLCTPYVHTFTTGSFVFSGHSILTRFQPRALSQEIDSFFIASSVSLFTFFALLSIAQSMILRTDDCLSMDFEAQSETVVEVSHKKLLLSRMEVFPGQPRNRWTSARASKNPTGMLTRQRTVRSELISNYV